MPTGNSRPAQRIPAAPEPPDARPRGELKGPRDALLEIQVSWPRSCRHLELGFTTPPQNYALQSAMGESKLASQALND